jgi:probable rRNA maturation factor
VVLLVDVSVDMALNDVESSCLTRFLAFAFERVDEAPDGEWTMTVRLADSAEISHLHSAFFGEETDTDVMSFPFGDNMVAGGGYLGDVAISLSVARDQAVEQGHTTQREILFLGAHGLLHLLGYDDTSDAERDAMLGLQSKLLEEFERLDGDNV